MARQNRMSTALGTTSGQDGSSGRIVAAAASLTAVHTTGHPVHLAARSAVRYAARVTGPHMLWTVITVGVPAQ